METMVQAVDIGPWRRCLGVNKIIRTLEAKWRSRRVQMNVLEGTTCDGTVTTGEWQNTDGRALGWDPRRRGR